MPLRTDSYYRQLVDDLLKGSGVDEPPTSMEEIARRMGVPIQPVDLPNWFTGALIIEPEGPMILLNTAISPKKSRDALGHMLGHVLVGTVNPAEAYPRAEEREHRIADMMSSEFVMPTYLVHEQARKWFNDYLYLAGLFGVSEGEMLEKMRSMGLIRTRGMVWDF
jgi:Zn-dependent peptidase ImmA (M78 family)